MKLAKTVHNVITPEFRPYHDGRVFLQKGITSHAGNDPPDIAIGLADCLQILLVNVVTLVVSHIPQHQHSRPELPQGCIHPRSIVHV